jgi:hypothetical protein
MAKLGVFVSVFFPPVSVFMVTMLPFVLLGIGMSIFCHRRKIFFRRFISQLAPLTRYSYLPSDFSGHLLCADMGRICTNSSATTEVLEFSIGSLQDFKVEPDPLSLNHPHQHFSHPCRFLPDQVSTLDNAPLSGSDVRSSSLCLFVALTLCHRRK